MEPGRGSREHAVVAARPGGGERSQLCLGSSPAKCVSRLACSRKGPSDPTGRLKMTRVSAWSRQRRRGHRFPLRRPDGRACCPRPRLSKAAFIEGAAIQIEESQRRLKGFKVFRHETASPAFARPESLSVLFVTYVQSPYDSS